jgi:hypothetical protein
LDQARPRTHRRNGAESLAIDLGNEPPLSVDGGNGNVIDRRRISVQWFSGTILTGVCGAALMGGAVFASLDGETNFATIPERVESALRGAIGGMGEKLTRKADRLPPVSESSGQRQLVRISTTVKVGDREVVRVRPYHRISANLVLTSTEYASSVPPFNAQKMLAQAGADGVAMDEQAGAEPDAEVSYVTRELALILPRTKLAGALPRSSPACATPRTGPVAAPATRSRACRREVPLRSLTRPTARPILTPVSRPGSFRKTSRSCRRPPGRRPAATPGASAR